MWCILGSEVPSQHGGLPLYWYVDCLMEVDEDRLENFKSQ